MLPPRENEMPSLPYLTPVSRQQPMPVVRFEDPPASPRKHQQLQRERRKPYPKAGNRKVKPSTNIRDTIYFINRNNARSYFSD